MKKLLAGLGLVLALASCSSTGGKPATVVTVTETVTAAAEPTPPDSADSSTEGPTDPSTDSEAGDTAKFGQAFAYDAGLKVLISPPSTLRLSDVTFESSKHAHHIKFTVTIVNGSKDRYDPTSFSTTLQAGQGQGEEVFDSTQNLNGSPDTVLLPGRSTKFVIGYGVDETTDLVLQVTPSFDYDAAVFTS